MTNLIYAQNLLLKEKHTCVLYNGDKRYISDLRGVKPLVLWYTDKMDFADFSAADKVVGRATAFLYILLKVKNIYAEVISASALSLLKKNQIAVIYGELVPNIRNRKGDGICPFEAAVLDIEEPLEAYREICRKMQEMNITLD